MYGGGGAVSIADLAPLGRAREQRAWSWYDWANSAYFTTIVTVFFGPWLIHVAEQAAPDCSGAGCVETLHVLGVPIAAGALPGYLIALSTVVSAVLLPVVGAVIDRSGRKKTHLAAYGWAGAACASLLFFVDDGRWQLGAVAIVSSNLLMGCSLVCYNAILVDISTESERDRVSSRGWAWGYLGGGLLLALNLAVFLLRDSIGVSEGVAVRVNLLSAALWWGAFTIIPAVRLSNHPARAVEPVPGETLLRRSFGQLFETLRELPRYRQTMIFLIAYLFFNDGIQTVVTSASTYGAEQLDLGQTVLTATILLVQFVAFGGALLFGRLAVRYGAYRPIMWGLFGWMAIIVAAFCLPVGAVALFLLLGVAIAVVLGGTQALARSFFSLFIPVGREGEYFALYQMCERGTSWIGTLTFALVYQLTGSYRPSILALLAFFVIGAAVLSRLDVRAGIAQAGNRVPNAL